MSESFHAALSMSVPPALKLGKLSFASFGFPLKIKVGKKKQEFYVSKELICCHSDFFKTACKKEWKSGRDNVVCLEEDDPKIFALFLAWLTTGSIKASNNIFPTPKLDGISVDDHVRTADNENRIHDIIMNDNSSRFYQLLECYFLGDCLQSEAFQNHIIDEILVIIRYRDHIRYHYPKLNAICLCTGFRAIQTFYAKTTAKSPLRRLLLEYHLHMKVELTSEYMAKFIKGGLQDYVFEMFAIAKKFYGTSFSTAPWDRYPCYYHSHGGLRHQMHPGCCIPPLADAI
ncbi:hypothetical protein GLAREA_08530 [Glarea lozoyensis ATCC 20868]|uniref:BTB domain-containing protein n=1 Tax=Glarea lozoyensis (strain ATCC 20868 / MF5171) TaxID=1116229 RepID=S3CDT0_GLAL2|nr:uncharacterized protein GLAREA_08530 [Glarea lozoyensis ATCC 20868]EPE24677.1 hypothetical protein GLAREA_08530 [Glarea lozoyensis ATCC 20868]